MPVYRNGKRQSIYCGDANPAELYKDGKKVAGWAIKSGNGSHIFFDNTYNDRFIDFMLYGMSTQDSYSGTNLAKIKAYNSLWTSGSKPFTTSRNGWIALEILDTNSNKTFHMRYLTHNHPFSVVAREMDVDGNFIRTSFLGLGNETDPNQICENTFSVRDDCKLLAINLFTNKAEWAVPVDETNISELQINVGKNRLKYEPYVGGEVSPSMKYPQEINDLFAKVVVPGNDSVAQEYANIIRGIKVKSGGNYTDENGQQWYCDTVDLSKGIYTQRVKNVDVYLNKAQYNTPIGYRWSIGGIKDAAQVQSPTGDPVLCNRLPFNAGAGASPTSTNIGIRMSGSYNTLVAEFVDDEHERVMVNVTYMINPVEIPIYKTLRTSYPSTTVSANTDRVSATVRVAN